MIGNAHLDPVWLWQWQEGFQEARATFRSVLNLMNEADDFLFTSSSAALYEWIEQNDPDMFDQILARVAEGRWEIVGGWWIQPDCNLPSGESFVRQGLYGQRYFSEKLGVTATVGYNVDSFGHAASLPQILLKSGMTSYVFMRPHPHEQKLPARLFWWESDDGSRVLAYRIPYEYCTWPHDLRHHVERCAGEFREGLDELMCFYGVGDHGGGPTRENIESIRRLEGDASLPSLRFSTPGRYFERVRAGAQTAPVVHDELQHHASGCYSAHSGVKQWNRQAENLLTVAERFAAIAHRVTGQPYPSDFGRAWKAVLFNQFHDILAGTSIEPAYDDARYLYGEAMAIASRNLNNALQQLAGRLSIAAEEGARSIVVFNPHAWPVRANVELEFGRLTDADGLLDAVGAQVPLQMVRSLATVSSGSRTRLSFPARLPPLGYTVFKLAQAERPARGGGMEASDSTLENEYLRLTIDPRTGALAELYDKRLDFEWLRGPAAKPLVLDDPSDTWSHGVWRFDSVIGEFTGCGARLVEHGPVKSVIAVEAQYGTSRLTQEFTMYPGVAQIDVHVTVDWREHFKMLKLSFPLNLNFTSSTYEVPYGVIERPANGEEEPGQTWVDLSGVGRSNGIVMGMSILNDAKYSFDIKDRVINLTVLRSPIYAHHLPYEPTPDGRYTFHDQGIQRFRYSLLPHGGPWQQAGTPRRAAELNQPPIALQESSHPGTLPHSASFASVEYGDVAVTALKQAEDGKDLIMRCFDASGRGGRAVIQLPEWERSIEAVFRPSEVKTFRIPADASHDITETNLIEWDQ